MQVKIEYPVTTGSFTFFQPFNLSLIASHTHTCTRNNFRFLFSKDSMGETSSHWFDGSSRILVVLVVVCGFCYELGRCINWQLCCWSVFWDLYCAAPERRDAPQNDSSNEAKAFHDYGFINSGSYNLPNGLPNVGSPLFWTERLEPNRFNPIEHAK